MLDDPILQLRAAFDNLPLKGLFFWLSLLLPENVPYDSFVQKTFADLAKSDSDEKSEILDQYQKIAQSLIHARHLTMTDPEFKIEVEKIRDAIIKNAAHETIMDQIKKDLAKNKTNPATHSWRK
jgi:hypothetical protein